MFPIVPQDFSPRGRQFLCPETLSSFVTGASKLLVPGKVTAAAGGIAQGTATDAVEAARLVGQPDVVQISARITPQGTIDLEHKSKSIWNPDIHWVRALRLSDDCHTYNVQLQFQSSHKSSPSCDPKSNKLILQAVRPIETGQELLLWFSEDVMALLQIPFLTPANIQGQKKYVCTRCSALYESPNPLKLHIALSCGRQTITSLWERLSTSLQENSARDEHTKTTFTFKLSTVEVNSNSSNSKVEGRQPSAMDLSVPNEDHTKKGTDVPQRNLYRPYTEPSAFTPFRKTDIHMAVPLETVPIWTMMPFDPGYSLPPVGNEDEAHIETFVSSLGKSKQGHICLYCGKCYSRKYGLKIHIRTHTGYKPLKCKFCLRPFGDPSNLNKHVRLHAEGSTPYKCDLCGKVLVRRRDLDRHLKSRHMVDMHPGMNILQDDSNPDDEGIKTDDLSR